MYNVLMPVDKNGDRAMGQVEAVRKLPATSDAVRVTLLHVFRDEEVAQRASPTQLTAGRQAEQRLRDQGVNVETMSTSGDPAEAILEAAEESDADQIVLGGRKRSPLGSLIFGSTSQAVMLDSTRPVTITGGIREQGQPIHRCRSCGEEYYGGPTSEIETCRGCGGTKVRAVE
jgi:nucleotide-binding universal stress UspA family protein